MRHLALFALVSLSSVACGDIDVKSIRVVDVVPRALEGEWRGQWSSTEDSGAGTVTLRMQDFEGEAVVSLQLDNPCIEKRSYQFVTSGNLLQLLADGVVVFSAVLGGERSMAGTYECAADVGVWSVDWTRSLAAPVDLGGQWMGSVTVPGLAPMVLQLDLDLFVQGGTLMIEGTATLFPDGMPPTTLPVTGSATFLETTFDLRLVAPTSDVPNVGVQLFGGGSVAALRVDVGTVQTNDPGLPFHEAIWQAQRLGP